MKPFNHSCVLLFCLLLLSFNLKSQVIVQGVGLESNKQVALHAFSAAQMDYELWENQDLRQGASFEFRIPEAAPNLYQLVFDDNRKVTLSIDSEKEIRIRLQKEGVEIEGSENSRAMLSLGDEIGQLQYQFFGKLKKSLDQAMADKDQALAEQLMKEANDAIPLFVGELRKKILAFGTSPATYFALQFSDFNKEQVFIAERLEAMEKAIPESPVTKALAALVEQSSVTAVGKTPPAINGEGRGGINVSLESFKGKVVLIDFWASWCRACRVENPKFVELYEKYDRSQFEILSISSDETAAIWEKAIAKDGVGAWFHLLDSKEAIFKQYSVTSLPQNIVLGRNGKIIAKNVNAETLAELLMKLKL